MSSPIRRAEDLDAALTYAPPWVRDRARERARQRVYDEQPLEPAMPLAERAEPPRRWRIGRPGQTFSGDLAMAKLQRQLAMHPDAVPQPPFEDEQSLWPIAGRIGAVAVIAALVAWGMVSMPGGRPPRSETKPAGGTSALAVSRSNQEAAPVVSAAPTTQATQLVVKHSLAKANVPPVEASLPTMPQPAPPQPAAPPPSAQPQPATPPDNAAVAPNDDRPQLDKPLLDNGEIAMLVKRGKDYLANGDLASARLLLRRAAEAGSADAALALGATFDPLVIRRLGAVGAAADAAKAREWYQKAVDLGSAAAAQQLAKLTQSAP